jgi:class 3 adenylate cyclase
VNRHSIRWRLIVTMLSLIIILVIILTYIQIQSQQEILENELTKRELLMRKTTLVRGQSFTNNLTDQVAIEMTAFNFSKAYELIRTAVKDEHELAYGILMDQKRVVHIHTQQPELELETLSAPADVWAAEQQQSTWQQLEHGDEEIVEFVAPIRIGTQIWGVLRLGLSMTQVANDIAQSREEIQEQNQIMVIHSIVTALFFLLFGSIIVFVISTKISRPLLKLTQSAHELANGNFATHIPVYPNSQDEVSILARTFADMVTNLEHSYKRLEQYNKAYERFVPREFLSLLDKHSILDINLGDQVEKAMTVLFSDIRGFTSLSEKMTPQENFNFINAYLMQMAPVIEQHNGFIDKYIGDAIMALFPIRADDAMQSAIAMLKRLAEYNQGRRRANYQPLAIGIGLNTGPLMLGTVGWQNRMDGTVISDAVNLASRIEGMTKMYGATLLISESTYSKLPQPSPYLIRPVDRVKVKGKSAHITVYEVFDCDPAHLIELKLKTLVYWQNGWTHYYQKELSQARLCFKHILRIYLDDKLAQIYLERCENLQKNGIPADWQGIETLNSK